MRILCQFVADRESYISRLMLQKNDCKMFRYLNLARATIDVVDFYIFN